MDKEKWLEEFVSSEFIARVREIFRLDGNLFNVVYEFLSNYTVEWETIIWSSKCDIHIVKNIFERFNSCHSVKPNAFSIIILN